MRVKELEDRYFRKTSIDVETMTDVAKEFTPSMLPSSPYAPPQALGFQTEEAKSKGNVCLFCFVKILVCSGLTSVSSRPDIGPPRIAISSPGSPLSASDAPTAQYMSQDAITTMQVRRYSQTFEFIIFTFDIFHQHVSKNKAIKVRMFQKKENYLLDLGRCSRSFLVLFRALFLCK